VKNDAAIKWDRDRQQRRWAAIDAALSKNPKMTHIEDRKIVAKNLWNILDKFERDGHAKKETVLRDANMGEKGNSTKQLFYYTLRPFDTVSAALEKRIDRLVKRTDKYRRLAEVAAKKAEWDTQGVLIELFKGSSYDASEQGPIPQLPEYLFAINGILQRMKDWLVQNTRIEWYYQTLRKEDVCDEWGNFIFGRHVSSVVDASDSSSNVPPTIRYGKAIPGIVFHRILGAELPVDFVPEPKFEYRSDDDIPGMDAEPPSNLPVEHLKFRRYFEIRLGLAPVGASGKIGLVFDQRRVDEVWNEKECRAYVPVFFWQRPKAEWETFDVYDRPPPPVGVFANYDYVDEVGGGWLRFKADVDDTIPPYELSVDANNPDVPREEYASRVIQDQWVEEVDPWTCKKYLSQKVDATYGSTAVESPMGTLASRIENNLYWADDDDRYDTLLKKEVDHRCSLLEQCGEQRRRLVNENKRRLYSRWGIKE
jgi:hypothetical protein